MITQDGRLMRYEDAGLRARIREARKDVEDPSEAQKEYGNYRKGHVTIQGLPITIETRKGGIRSGKSKDGKEWSITMASDYGYIKRTESEADGDHIDVFIGPHPESEIVFVIDQVKQSGRFDEHKVMIGWTNESEARSGYLANYSDGWTGLGAIKALRMADFKEWIECGATGERIEDQRFHYSLIDAEGRLRNDISDLIIQRESQAMAGGDTKKKHTKRWADEIKRRIALGYPMDYDEDEPEHYGFVESEHPRGTGDHGGEFIDKQGRLNHGAPPKAPDAAPFVKPDASVHPKGGPEAVAPKTPEARINPAPVAQTASAPASPTAPVSTLDKMRARQAPQATPNQVSITPDGRMAPPQAAPPEVDPGPAQTMPAPPAVPTKPAAPQEPEKPIGGSPPENPPEIGGGPEPGSLESFRQRHGITDNPRDRVNNVAEHLIKSPTQADADILEREAGPEIAQLTAAAEKKFGLTPTNRQKFSKLEGDPAFEAVKAKINQLFPQRYLGVKDWVGKDFDWNGQKVNVQSASTIPVPESSRGAPSSQRARQSIIGPDGKMAMPAPSPVPQAAPSPPAPQKESGGAQPLKGQESTQQSDSDESKIIADKVQEHYVGEDKDLSKLIPQFMQMNGAPHYKDFDDYHENGGDHRAYLTALASALSEEPDAKVRTYLTNALKKSGAEIQPAQGPFDSPHWVSTAHTPDQTHTFRIGDATQDSTPVAQPTLEHTEQGRLFEAPADSLEMYADTVINNTVGGNSSELLALMQALMKNNEDLAKLLKAVVTKLAKPQAAKKRVLHRQPNGDVTIEDVDE